MAKSKEEKKLRASVEEEEEEAARQRKAVKEEEASDAAARERIVVRRKERKAKARKVARREPVVIVIPPPWSPADHKAAYLEILNGAKNRARLKLSGQLLAVMHGQTTEKDGDPIPAPVANLGRQLSGMVEQVATKAAIEELTYNKRMYERERQHLIEEKAAQDKARAAEAAKAQRGHAEVVVAE